MAIQQLCRGNRNARQTAAPRLNDPFPFGLLTQTSDRGLPVAHIFISGSTQGGQYARGSALNFVIQRPPAALSTISTHHSEDSPTELPRALSVFWQSLASPPDSYPLAQMAHRHCQQVGRCRLGFLRVRSFPLSSRFRPYARPARYRPATDSWPLR